MTLKIVFKTGSIFTSKAGLLVNPVNTEGVMGAGLAKQFKSKFKSNYQEYVKHCEAKNHSLYRFGTPVFEDKGVLICNFPTKEQYRFFSKLGYIRRGLIYLRGFLESYPYRERLERIAIPALGCGLGGLSTLHVLHLILYHLKFVDFDITVELYGFMDIPKTTRDFMRTNYDLSHGQEPRYTGVGSRETDHYANSDIHSCANVLARMGYLCVTGDASRGGDKEFWEATPEMQRIRFGPYGRKQYSPKTIVVPPNSDAYKLAVSLVSKLHPAWRYLDEFPKELHTRNTFQVLGQQLSQPSEFLLCWTPDGAVEKTTKKTGGTGMAIRIANQFGVPVFNLRNDNAIVELGDFLGIDILRMSF